MNNKSEFSGINKVAVFLALFYAFSTRSVIGSLVYRGALLWIFYGATYFALGVCLINYFRSSRSEGFHQYAPNFIFIIIMVFSVILFGLYRTGDKSSLLYYGIAILVPFAMEPGIKGRKGISIAFVTIGIILFLGCLINYAFPTVYRTMIIPLFSRSAQVSLVWQASLRTYFPGFTSQVGYTSYFLCMAFGALFCFRKIVYNRWFVPLAIMILLGLLLTGKRAPTLFLLVSIMFLYFFESRERERFTRVLQIVLITLGAFIALFLLARFTNNPAINRIFESVQNVILSRDVEDVGRDQLWTQAMTYFYDNKWLGIGWTNFKNIFTLRGTHVHNIYIQLLCETGIIGFSVFAFFFVWNIRTTLRRIKTAKKGTCEYSWLMLSLFMQIYFLLYGITGNPLYDVEETILFFFGAGISYLPMLDDVAEDAGKLSAKATLTRPIGLPIKGKYIK